jgi:hypothetical protein
MNHTCTVCGSSWSQAVANVAALGIQPERLRSIYSCCQAAEWALEQQLVWAEAAQEESRRPDDLEEAEGVLVPVRLRHSRASRSADHSHRS